MITFEKMPETVASILEKLNGIEKMLEHLPPKEQPKQTLLNDDLLDLLREHGIHWSESTLNKNCSLGRIPYTIRSKRRVFDRDTILNWIKQGLPDASELKAIDHLQKQTQ